MYIGTNVLHHFIWTDMQKLTRYYTVVLL